MGWFKILKTKLPDDERYGWDKTKEERNKLRAKTFDDFWVSDGEGWNIDISKIQPLPDPIPDWIVKDKDEAIVLVNQWAWNKIIPMEAIEDIEVNLEPRNVPQELLDHPVYGRIFPKNSNDPAYQKKLVEKSLLDVQTIQWNLPQQGGDLDDLV